MKIVVFVLMTGGFFASCVFAVGLEGLLSESYRGAKDISKVFDTKGSVTNIYSRVLDLKKTNEMKVLFQAVDQIIKIHPELADCGVSRGDVIAILYFSDSNFKTALDLTVLDKNKKKTTLPTTGEILRAYKQIIRCRDPDATMPNFSDKGHIDQVFANEYASPSLDQNYAMATLRDANFGRDIYKNATLDDSDYDLLIDIEAIGIKLFESFESPTQTLFYQLPTITNTIPGGGNNNLVGGTPGLGNFIASSSPSASPTAITSSSSSSSSSSITSLNSTLENLLLDLETENFIQTTNTPAYPSTTQYQVPGDGCETGVAAEAPMSVGSFIDDATYQAYLDEMIYTITEAPENIYTPTFPQYTGTIANPAYQAEAGFSSDFDTASNTFAEEMVDEILNGSGQSCMQKCNDSSDISRMKCITNCVKACVKSCTGLPSTEKMYCQSQCLCFMISGPVGAQRTGMDDMYKLKFCTIPVENGRVRGGKKVYSIEAIFLEIKKVFDALLNSGEMIKRKRPKEHFDTSIGDIKFRDLFSFSINMDMKPLFGNVSSKTDAKQQKQINETKEINELGDTPADQNKYVIIADVAKNRAEHEMTLDLDEWEQNMTDIEELESRANASSSSSEKAGQDQQNAELNQTFLEFTETNALFRSNVLTQMKDMNDMVVALKTKIESAKE